MLTTDRPAEAENFDKLAQEAYEKKYPGKKYDDLSYEYRRKLRYGAIKEYGRDKAYKKMPYNTTFADYLKSQPESFQKEWLGAKRYEMYKDGKLPLEYMVNPDTGFKRTVKDLEKSFMSDRAERDGWSNTFWDKVDSIKDYNSVKEIAVPSEMEAAIRANGFRDVNDFAKQVNDYVKSNDVLHRCRLRDILDKLADEPVLKNQFETGTSNATDDLDGRRQWERVVSGGKSDDMMHRERPVYGYVGNVQKVAQSVDGYGDTTVVFKRSVRDRMTFTLGNSTSQQGAFCDDVRAVFNNDRQNKFYDRHIGTVPNMMGNMDRFYLESQIWGSADLRQDVSEIAIGVEDLQHVTNNVKLETWQRFVQQMNSANVKITRYVDMDEEKIKNNPNAWRKLQADMERLGIILINIAK